MNTFKSLSSAFSSEHKKIALLLIVLAGVNTLLYLNTLHFNFLKDDFRLIVENPRVKDFQSFTSSIGSKFFAFPDFPYLHYWRPLSLFSFYLDYKIWGLNPSGFHLSNIVINTANALLVFMIIYLLFKKINYAFLGSLFFSIHPCHVEAVSWISGRTDLLAAFFVLAAMLFFLLFMEKKKTSLYILALLSFLLALLSKENSALFPLLAVGLVFIYFIEPARVSPPETEDDRETDETMEAKESTGAIGSAGSDGSACTDKSYRKRLLLLTLPFWVLDFGYIVLHNHFSGVQDVVQNFSLKDIFVIMKTIGAYTKIILMPFFPTPHFSMHQFDQGGAEFYLYFAGAVGLLVLLWVYRRNYRFSLYSLLFLIFLLPVIDPEIVPSYPKIVIRFAYIPSIFAGIFFMDTIKLFRNKLLRVMVIVLLALIGINWAIESYRFQEYYKDEFHHYNDVSGLTRFYPEDCSLLLPLALMKAQEGDYPKALELVNRALEVNNQDQWLDISEMGGLLKANLLVLTDDPDKGKALAEQIISVSRKDEMKYFGCLVLAKYYEKKADFPAALDMLNKAEKIGATADVYFRMALIHGKMNNFPLALRCIDQAINLNPAMQRYREFKEFLNARK